MWGLLCKRNQLPKHTKHPFEYIPRQEPVLGLLDIESDSEFADMRRMLADDQFDKVQSGCSSLLLQQIQTEKSLRSNGEKTLSSHSIESSFWEEY